MEFLPNDSATVPLVPGQVVEGLSLEGLPLPIVDQYMYLGILMTPGLAIESMVNHRVRQGQATVATVIPYLRCPVLPMSMRLVTVAVVVGPRLLFGAELYGMSQHLTDKMQRLMNRQSPQSMHWCKKGRECPISGSLERDQDIANLCSSRRAQSQGLCQGMGAQDLAQRNGRSTI